MAKRFLRHEECPVCGSADNVAVYWNDELNGETYSCMTTGCNYKKTDNDLLKGGKAKEYTTTPRHVDAVTLPENRVITERAGRKLTKASAALYEMYYLQTDEVFLFPYYSRLGQLVGYKTKSADKTVRFKGDKDSIELYGMPTCSGDRVLIITEGEEDAIAARQMTGYSSVSVPFGAQSAAKYVKKSLEWIEQFNTIYICFDNDEPGIQAANACMEVLNPAKARLVSLPPLGKDANEFLVKGLDKEFKNALYAAKQRTPSTLYERSSIKEKILGYLLNTNKLKGTTTGLLELDNILGGGWRPKETTVILAGTSIGKSTFSRYLMGLQMAMGNRCLLFSFEEPPEVSAAKTLGLMKHFHVKEAEHLGEEYLSEQLDVFLECLEVSTVRASDMTPEAVYKTIEYGVRSRDVKFVVFDNLTRAVSGQDDSDVRTIAKLMATLHDAAIDFGCHCLILTHTHRDKSSEDGTKMPTLSSAKWAGAIEQYTDNALGLARKRDSNTTTIGLLKNRAFGFGIMTEFKLEFNQHEGAYEEKANTNTWRSLQGEKSGGEGSTMRQSVRGSSSSEQQTADTPTAESESLSSSDGNSLHAGLPTTERRVRGGEGEANRELAEDDKAVGTPIQPQMPESTRTELKTSVQPIIPANLRGLANQARNRLGRRHGDTA